MRCVLVVCTLLALAAGQSTDAPDQRCKCELGAREDHHQGNEFTVLFRFHDAWEEACDHRSAEVCREECQTRRDLLDLFGGWSVVVPDTIDGNNSTVGEIACRNLGRDEGHGIVSELFTAVCEEEFAEAGHGVREPLCCADGEQVECRHQP